MICLHGKSAEAAETFSVRVLSLRKKMERAMKFIYEPALQEYMKRKQKNTIVVEVVTSNNSDFEVTELHVHPVDEKRAAFFIEKKHFKEHVTEYGSVLLPPYRLEYEETVTFGLKKILFVQYVTWKGIHL